MINKNSTQIYAYTCVDWYIEQFESYKASVSGKYEKKKSVFQNVFLIEVEVWTVTAAGVDAWKIKDRLDTQVNFTKVLFTLLSLIYSLYNERT